MGALPLDGCLLRHQVTQSGEAPERTFIQQPTASPVCPRQSLAALLLCWERWESSLAAAGVLLAEGRGGGALAALGLLTVVLLRAAERQ